MSGPLWSILVVSYNSTAEVRDLLSDLKCHPDLEHNEILVAENGSDDLDAMRKLAHEHEIKLVELANPGFGAACNLLAKMSVGKYLLLANPDLRLPHDILPRMADTLCSLDVGSVGPVLLNEDGSEQFSWNLEMNLWWEFLEAHGLQNWWRRRLTNKFKQLSPNGPWNVGFTTAACLAIRAEAFHRVGGFDETFFLNYEDIELGDRLRANGYSNVVRPDIEALHRNSLIQSRNLANFVYHRLEAKRCYIKIHYHGWRHRVATLLCLDQIAMRLIIGFVFLKGQQRSRLNGYIRALMSYR